MINDRKKTVSSYAVFLSLFVLLAFIMHLVTYAANGLVYCAAIAISVFLMALTKPIIRHSIPGVYLLIWFLVILVLWYNYFFRYSSNTVLIDHVVLTCGFLSILLFSRNARAYDSALQTIKLMAYIIAFSVYLQLLAPSVYRTVIVIFPSRLQSSLSSGLRSSRAIKGFATNVGFTANYIIAGMFVLLSSIRIGKKPGAKTSVLLLLLFIALLMTGKRGSLLFFLIAVFLVNIIPVRGMQKMKKVWGGFLAVLAVVVLFSLFESALEELPFIGRYIKSINSYLEGEDVSSGRSKLYLWAVQLFLENPVLGIGWGRYRLTAVGNATLIKSLDTHNVYLQLLSETGLVGFSVFMALFLYSWNTTRSQYCECLRSRNEALARWRPMLFFSFVFQTYFLLFGLTGNPLYDQFYQVMYAFSGSIMVAYRHVSAAVKKREGMPLPGRIKS